MLTSLLFRLYSVVKNSGFLETGLGRWCFGSAYFLYKRLWEDPFAALIKSHPELFRGGDVLDVGANIGYTASLFVRAVDAGRVVHAFEPEPRNADALDRLAGRTGGTGRILPIHAAVGAQSGTISLCINEDHPGDHRILTSGFENTSRGMPRLDVAMISLDEYLSGLRPRPPIAFVKVDVQGFELAVCRGMEQLIEANPNITLAFEYMPQAMSELGYFAEDLLGWIRQRGFYIYLVKSGGNLQPVTGDLSVGKRGYEDIVCRREPIE